MIPSWLVWLTCYTFGLWLIGGVCGLNDLTAATAEVGDE